jgi:hypothetical protein
MSRFAEVKSRLTSKDGRIWSMDILARSNDGRDRCETSLVAAGMIGLSSVSVMFVGGCAMEPCRSVLW